MRARLDALRQQLAEHKLDAILITQPENRRYLSGFTGSAGALLISHNAAVLATDFRYYEQAQQEAPDFRLVRAGYDLLKHLPDLLQELKIQRAGFEAHHVSYAFYQELIEATPDVTWEPTNGLLEELRAVKDEDELAIIRRAVELADKALAEVWPLVRPGITEREVAWQLETALHHLGADDTAFEIIVASGPNAALPHARAGDRQLQTGEPVIIDMGARVDGYRSDLTRTMTLGEPDARFREIYTIVREAQEAAEAGLRAGMTGKEADHLARSIIEAAGYGEYFGHSLGHGVGLAIHERPRLSPRADDVVLRAGMVTTVEPGIYLPGWGGVRLEDIVVITEEGVEILTRSPKLF